MTPFIIYALPRSRTYWMSKFLSYGLWSCDHDMAVRLRGLDDVRSALDTPYYGSCETGAAPFWRLIHKMRPDLRTVVIRRSQEESIHSLTTECGTTFDGEALARIIKHLDAKLDQIVARVPGVLELSFDALNTEEGCKALFEHCLQQPFDPAWWRIMAPMRLVVNFPAQMRYCTANAAQIARMTATAAQRMRLDLTLSHRVASDSMTYAEEPFETFLRDGRALIAQHHVAVGKSADEVGRMNLEMMQTLAEHGVLHVTTARSNGRMFGYLMTLTGPGLESPDKVEMHTTAFYADPCAPGVGAKLQRSAIETARTRGVQVVYSRAGNRGSGSRIGALFKRLGAAHFGDLYALELELE